VLRLAQIEAADTADEQIADCKDRPHRTLTVDDDSPSPGGDAKGLWNACPEIPLPRWGREFARNAPPKKYAPEEIRPRRNTPPKKYAT
jgi:hypothetical protein